LVTDWLYQQFKLFVVGRALERELSYVFPTIHFENESGLRAGKVPAPGRRFGPSSIRRAAFGLSYTAPGANPIGEVLPECTIWHGVDGLLPWKQKESEGR
jgi:hypothetical protein